MPKIAHLIGENQSKFPAPPKTTTKIARVVSRGAAAFCSILHCFTGATDFQVLGQGSKRRLSVEGQMAAVNESLKKDGKQPASRATFFRWKAEARAAGLLRFKSSAWRKRDRSRLTAKQRKRLGGNGCKMTVVAVPFAVEGRRPRQLNETFSAPPPRETFSAPPPLRDSSPQADTSQPSDPNNAERIASESERPPQERERSQPAFPDNVIEAEQEMTQTAQTVSEIVGIPWEPLSEKQSWRLGTIAREAHSGCPTWKADASVVVVGMALSRAADIKRAHELGQYHDFWEVAEGDIVARALTHDRGESLYRRGAKWLWNTHGIDCEAEGFDGIHAPPPSRAEAIHQEVMVGA